MSLTLSDIGKAVLDTHYAVRGPIVARAQELERAGREIIYCNIGNPQALGQKPLSFVRQVLALAEWPELAAKVPDAFPADVVATAKKILADSKYGLGAYSESKGLKFVREAVAEFIRERDTKDGVVMEANPEHIYLTDGASKGVQTALRMLIASDRDGIMIPIPQYPLYSASITLFGGVQVGYYLDEPSGWGLSRTMLEEAYLSARVKGIRVKAICVINPGNPTGTVLSHDTIAMVIDFASEHGLAVLADEVYQENIYRPEDRFVSFAHVITECGEKDVSLFSFHSCSKGFLGECGHRGGYMEVRNMPAEIVSQITKLQSISLCANLPGQVLIYLMVRPPREGDPSYEIYRAEREAVLGELKKRAGFLADGLNRIPGFSCQAVTGAMYAFPSISLPAGKTDEEYCMALLERTGVCVVPGSGFGQMEGTAHFRTTILPPTNQIEAVVTKIEEFHRSWK
ncbi:MAG TPA: aminotransferase class I/II-fold pyridoxal phosphate-dependent enzyme [Rectinemataceae bacterium]|nr:aminotransferase class I/II-fold pyridoxal phosphate-dependent enzyme [Rectinemataceae bacterium]